MAQPEFPFPDPYSEDISFYEIKDGDMVDADVWNRERACQLQRQKLYSQSLCEPGIVCGLRVRVNNALCKDKDEENKGIVWLEVEAGFAIDAEGNFLLLTDEPKEKRYLKVNLDNILKQKSRQAYQNYVLGVYISAVPTRKLKNFNGESKRLLIEDCKVDLSYPEKSEKSIQLCRFVIDKNVVEEGLSSEPKSFFAPTKNELDFRYRRYFQARPTKVFQVGLVQMGDQDISLVEKSFHDLMDAANALYPKLTIKPIFKVVEIKENNQPKDDDQLSIVRDCDCLFWKIDPDTLKTFPKKEDKDKNRKEKTENNAELNKKPTLSKFQFQQLEKYLNEGGFLWIEDCSDSKAELAVFNALEGFKSQYIDEDEDTSSLEDSQNKEGTWQSLEPTHPICTTPFAFQSLPLLPDTSNENTDKKLVSFQHLSRMLLCHGELSMGWLSSASLVSQTGNLTKRPKLNLSRSEIREAQELGINIINFIWDLQQVRGFQVKKKKYQE